MAMQGSGAISLAQIQTEHGGSNPISLNEYYKDAGYANFDGTGVPAFSPNNNIPTSGNIQFSDFLGSKGIITRTITSSTTNYNLRNDLVNSGLWNGSEAIAVHLVISSGIYVYGSTNVAAITALLTTSSILSIHNSGTIRGKGGNRGAGGLANTSANPGSAGSAGYEAIQLQNISGVVIRNYGSIQGGGGGGGGGGGARLHGSQLENDEESGGQECVGGNSYHGGLGGYGASYLSQTSAATTGAPSYYQNVGGSAGPSGRGGNGGSYGAAGAGGAGGGGSGCNATNGGGGTGGAAGKAIRHVGGVLAQTIAVTGTINGATA